MESRQSNFVSIHDLENIGHSHLRNSLDVDYQLRCNIFGMTRVNNNNCSSQCNVNVTFKVKK
ncbi:hypothetical protein V1477_000962 [Vespula maculifrons]|uniref:Uncharacterized protein n=1 Tax=Vespula maculifrons TaxID=7453 RepID=A0ABD2D1N4_VESMC